MTVNRILIIEDEPSIVYVLQEMFKDSGYDTVGVKCGEDGLKELNKKPLPDLVIVDLNMPGIKGKDVVNIMREDEILKDIPVIIITGTVYNTIDFPPIGTYQATLEKPFDLAYLLELVNGLIK